MLAIGCDHGGYALKEEVKKHLDERGIEYIDNAEYREEMDCWGSSDQPEKVAALRFSFKEEQK